MLALPLRDSPNVLATPWCTWILAIVHLMVLAAVEWLALSDVVGVDPTGMLAGLEISGTTDADPLRYPTLWTEHAFWLADADPLSLLTGLFLHTGVVATVVGVLLLLLVGDNVEHHVGRPVFLGLYVAGGLLGPLAASWLFGPVPAPPIVGSGGALGALMGAYVVFFPRNEIQIAYLTGRQSVHGTPLSSGGAPFVPAWLGIPLCAVILSVANGFSGAGWEGMPRAADSVLPGLAFGVVAAFALRRFSRTSDRQGSQEWYPSPLSYGGDARDVLAEHIREDRVAEAARVYLETRDSFGATFAPADLEVVAGWFDQSGMYAAARETRERAAALQSTSVESGRANR